MLSSGSVFEKVLLYSAPRRGSREGETGEFSPPLFLSPLLFFFLIPQILK